MPSSPPQRRVGLARALSKLGFCSRSSAFELIRAGRVRLNGRVRKDPETPVRLGNDKLQVDGSAVQAEKFIYLVMNKPRGIVTTAADEKGRDTVYSLLPKGTPWVGPVGRLDQASEGLLLLTNDSEWAARISAPETKLAKHYHVQVAAKPDEQLLKRMEEGILAGVDQLRASRASVLRSGAKNSWLQIELTEGKNRQIRRMLNALGIEVLRLIRVQVGPLCLGDLRKGEVRELEKAEKEQLDGAMDAS